MWLNLFLEKAETWIRVCNHSNMLIKGISGSLENCRSLWKHQLKSASVPLVHYTHFLQYWNTPNGIYWQTVVRMMVTVIISPQSMLYKHQEGQVTAVWSCHLKENFWNVLDFKFSNTNTGMGRIKAWVKLPLPHVWNNTIHSQIECCVHVEVI